MLAEPIAKTTAPHDVAEYAARFKAANPNAFKLLEAGGAISDQSPAGVVALAFAEYEPAVVALISGGKAVSRSTAAAPVASAGTERVQKAMDEACAGMSPEQRASHEMRLWTQNLSAKHNAPANAGGAAANRGKYPNGAAFGSGAGRGLAIAAIQARLDKLHDAGGHTNIDPSFVTEKIVRDAGTMLADPNRGKYPNGAAFGTGAGREFAIAAIQKQLDRANAK